MQIEHCFQWQPLLVSQNATIVSMTVLLLEPRVGPYKRDREKTSLGTSNWFSKIKWDTAVHDKLDTGAHDNFYSLHKMLQ